MEHTKKKIFVSPSKNTVQKKKKKKTKRKAIAKFFALCTNAILEKVGLFMCYTQTKKDIRS